MGVEHHLIVSAQLSDIRFWDVQSGFGYVFRAQFCATAQSPPLQVVLKVPKHSAKVWDQKSFNEELQVMAAVVHPNVVRFIGVWPRPDSMPIAATGAAYAVVTEYVASGTLTQRVLSAMSPSASASGSGGGGFRLLAVTCVDVLWQLAAAVAHLHGAGVVHRDLKPDNVLLTAQNEVKLCDFGLSRFGRMPSTASSSESSSSLSAAQGSVSRSASGSGVQSVQLDMTQAFGTLSYAAPEQFATTATESAALSSAVDVYAFGGVMYFLLTAQAPWSQEFKKLEVEWKGLTESVVTKQQSALIAQWVMAGRRPALSAELERDNQPYVQLMRWCWQQAPKDRPSMSEVQSELQRMHASLTAPTVASVQHLVAPLAAGTYPSLSLVPSGSSAGAGAGFLPLSDSGSSPACSSSSSSASASPAPFASTFDSGSGSASAPASTSATAASAPHPPPPSDSALKSTLGSKLEPLASSSALGTVPGAGAGAAALQWPFAASHSAALEVAGSCSSKSALGDLAQFCPPSFGFANQELQLVGGASAALTPAPAAPSVAASAGTTRSA